MQNFHLSFELYPPKTAEGILQLPKIAQDFSDFNPSFFSITSGAGGDGSKKTQDIVNHFCFNQLPVAPHIVCADETLEELDKKLNHYQQFNVSTFVLLRGDAPFSQKKASFPYAAKLVEHVRERLPHATIYVACYPEVHPENQSLKKELAYLKTKIKAGANAALTQIFFNPDAYGYFLDATEKENITIPIIPGILGIRNIQGLIAFCNKCQAELPRWLRFRLESYQNQKSQEAFVLEFLTTFCERLITLGAPGLHFYTLNHVEPILTLLKNLDLNDANHTTLHSKRAVAP